MRPPWGTSWSTNEAHDENVVVEAARALMIERYVAGSVQQRIPRLGGASILRSKPGAGANNPMRNRRTTCHALGRNRDAHRAGNVPNKWGNGMGGRLKHPSGINSSRLEATSAHRNNAQIVDLAGNSATSGAEATRQNQSSKAVRQGSSRRPAPPPPPPRLAEIP